jgi:hypothetical protein
MPHSIKAEIAHLMNYNAAIVAKRLSTPTWARSEQKDC